VPRRREVLPASAPVVKEHPSCAIVVVRNNGRERAVGNQVPARTTDLAPQVELVAHLVSAAGWTQRRGLAAHRGERGGEKHWRGARAILNLVFAGSRSAFGNYLNDSPKPPRASDRVHNP
tara:strand:- start:618 stop:977 length:360 start_codon:yes stop_codon:yes gene_type:complete